ncbi:MAG TPA: glycosyltransferase [Ignavibacteriales bacterium]|nr:glycosyltransferase [Ignavibacteriales bacterium]
MNKIFSVIVTYGYRSHYLFKVIESCFKNGINKIIVVDNNSKEREKIREFILRYRYNNKIIYIENNKNLGSAGGFKVGIEKALEFEDCEFLLLLDDDNKLSDNAVNVLISTYAVLKKEYGKVILRCYRPAVEGPLDIKRYSKIRCQTYGGFSLLDIPLKIFKVIFPRKYFRLNKEITKINVIKVCEVVWGGMFINKDLIIKEDLYPNEKLIIYCDDIEFSYRALRKGVHFFWTKDAYIEDLENPRGGGTKFDIFNIVFGSPIRTYYQLRNLEYIHRFVKPCSKRIIIRHLNRFIYLFIIKTSTILFTKFLMFRVINAAIDDGKNKKLGFNEKYYLL